eukprot:scaffold43919_cov42-Cyclotella_meneghiniana.AAC.1
MSAADPGEEFWGNLAAEQDFLDPDADDAWAHENEEFVDDDDDSSGCGVFDLQADGSYGLSLSARTTELADNDPPDASASGASEPQQPPQDDAPRPPRGRSDAHFIIRDQKAVFISFDIEIGGEYAGIIQYVNPGSGVHFEEQCVAVHGIHPSDPRIIGADKMSVVWADFCKWIEDHTFPDEVCILVAYNGQNCDMKWLWKLTQAPFAPYRLPAKIQWFMDPYRVITSYPDCPLNHLQSHLDSYELGVLWSYIHNGRNLNGAHDSLVDAEAQTDIIMSEHFASYIDRKKSIQPVADIFSKTQQNEWKKKMEPEREVHSPWKEQTAESNVSWKLDARDQYTGPSGGGEMVPTAYIKGVARRANNLADMFFGLLPVTFFGSVADQSNKYAYEDEVVEKIADDRDGGWKKRKVLVEAPKNADGSSHPSARHRADNEKYKFQITTGFVICWVAILILQGALFGTFKPPSRSMWMSRPYGIPIPCVQNCMSGAAYEFLQRFIHFADNSKRKSKGEEGYDPLYKVRSAMTAMLKGINKAWIVGQRVTVDESMIRYMGRAVEYVQYMPAKPIKHGIKVYAMCCAVTGIMIAWNVYTGAEDGVVNTTTKICADLAKQANIHTQKGRILYTDNYYTSVKLARYFFEEFGWTITGTYAPTDKKSRSDEDFPFLRLSRGARDSVKRGWFREAVLELRTPTGKKYYIQATTWRDKKQVCFLSSNEIGFSDGMSVKRHTKKRAKRDTIEAPRAQQDYSQFFNAVDRNDRDSSDYSTTIRTNRYYLRIFCWALDRIIHALYVIVVKRSSTDRLGGDWPEYWKLYKDIRMEGVRPRWMRRSEFVPCDCEKCFFCLNNLTTGIDHKRKKVTIQYACGSRRRTKKCTTERVLLKKKNGEDMKWKTYCKMCLRNQPKNDGYTAKERQKRCNKSMWGCAQQEPICDVCWPKYDKHKTKVD